MQRWSSPIPDPLAIASSPAIKWQRQRCFSIHGTLTLLLHSPDRYCAISRSFALEMLLQSNSGLKGASTLCADPAIAPQGTNICVVSCFVCCPDCFSARRTSPCHRQVETVRSAWQRREMATGWKFGYSMPHLTAVHQGSLGDGASTSCKGASFRPHRSLFKSLIMDIAKAEVSRVCDKLDERRALLGSSVRGRLALAIDQRLPHEGAWCGEYSRS